MQKTVPMKTQLHKLLYQALEIERDTMKIYRSELACAHTQELKDDLEGRLGRALAHEQVLLDMFKELGLNPDALIPSLDEAEAQRMDDEFVLVQETDVYATRDRTQREQIGHLAEHGLSDNTTRVEKSRGEVPKAQKVKDSG